MSGLRISTPYTVVLTDSGRARSFTSLIDACEHALFEHGQVIGPDGVVADYREDKS